MSKGLIDLKRANTPPANPLKPTKEKPTAVVQIVSESEQPSVANHNDPVPISTALPARTEEPIPAKAPLERVSTIGARIPESLHQNIKLFCIANRIEMQNFVQTALTDHLKKLQDAKSTNTE